MKRLMQRQGQIEADGSPAARRTAPPRQRPVVQPETSFGGRVAEFFRDVRSELRQVAWPSSKEVANSATIVLVVLVLLVSLIFLLNDAFSHAVIWLFKA
jgi:preprotein translocase subunit SecE